MARLPLPPAESMKLTVLAEIASGGMGSVELARVETGRLAGQTLAIKRLHPSIANDPTFVDMFIDEAWLTAALNNPHIMGVVAWGNDERGMFLAVELIEGVPLSRLIKEARIAKEQFSEQVVAHIVTQICEGLSEAHGLRGENGQLLGLVHRDLTPGNILVGFDGIVKIVDFGIAKAEERITHTRTGTMKGKPAYMAPEQAKGGKNLDLRADLFSLGVMIFELLALRRPWVEKSAFDVIMAAALKPAPDLNTIRPGVSPVFTEIITKCLEKKAADRFSTAAEIQAKLEAWRRTQRFPLTDEQVFIDFIRAHSAQQIEWYRQAHAGELAKGNAQTFKELEEAIDEARKRSGEMPHSMTSGSILAQQGSGRSALESLTPAKPRLVALEEPTPPPQSPHQVTLASAGAPQRLVTPAVTPLPKTMQSLSEASRAAQQAGPQGARRSQPMVDVRASERTSSPAVKPADTGLGGTIALGDDDLEAADLGASRTGGHRLDGTALIDPSPIMGQRGSSPPANRTSSSPPQQTSAEPALAPVESPTGSDLAMTIRMEELADRPIAEAEGARKPLAHVESRSIVRSVGVPHVADDMALGMTQRPDDASAARAIAEARKESLRPPPAREAPAAAPAPETKQGVSPIMVVLLVVLAFVAGGAAAAWYAKTYLLKPAGALDVHQLRG